MQQTTANAVANSLRLHIDCLTANSQLLTTDRRRCIDAERAAAVSAYKADWLAASHHIQEQ